VRGNGEALGRCAAEFCGHFRNCGVRSASGASSAVLFDGEERKPLLSGCAELNVIYATTLAKT
jgi:hypothetical protein